MPIPARRGSRPPAVAHRPPEPRGLRRQTTDNGHPTSIDQFIPGLYRRSAIVSDRRQSTPDTWNLERPACFEIVPTAARSGASRQICTARDRAISPHRACARGSCDDALTCEYREIVRRSGFSSTAEPGAISSSRCQTTRTRSGEPDRVRNHCFWTSRALPEATRMKRKKAAAHSRGDPGRKDRGRKDRNHATALKCGDRRSGGARRDRTDDLLLAKQALSQLSYGPSGAQTTDGGGQVISAVRILSSGNWWAWEDLNFRPHAYQARALTS
jgi:hypothetical protein